LISQFALRNYSTLIHPIFLKIWTLGNIHGWRGQENFRRKTEGSANHSHLDAGQHNSRQGISRGNIRNNRMVDATMAVGVAFNIAFTSGVKVVCSAVCVVQNMVVNKITTKAKMIF
jgi:hypothetical protein